MTTRGGARDCNHSADWEDTTGEGKLFSSEHLLVKNQSISTISRSMTRVWFTVDARSITVGLFVCYFPLRRRDEETSRNKNKRERWLSVVLSHRLGNVDGYFMCLFSHGITGVFQFSLVMCGVNCCCMNRAAGNIPSDRRSVSVSCLQ